MKIGIIVPSVEYLAQAGVRIRYRRIQPHIAAIGHELTIDVISDVRPADGLDCDVYIFSKCYDAAAPLLAASIRAKGKLVGVDIFDDMFSQSSDSRFVRHRAWMREMAPLIDFILCSTPRLSEVMTVFAPQAQVHILNDPYELFDADRLLQRIAEKRQEAIESKLIRVAWFGVGDNPHFQLGLWDLHAFAGDLAQLGQDGFDVQLRILTNRRALTEDGLRMMRNLPVRHVIEEWTRDGEIDLLDQSLVAFIPVNAQNFSIAKSLNRAISALTAGTQVLSAGYPLYRPLSDFIYRDPREIAIDLMGDSLKLGGQRIAKLRRMFDDWSDPDVEVGNFIDFLSALPASPSPPARICVVLHGRKSTAAVHKIARILGHLSVATPFASPKMKYDVELRPASTDTVDIHLSATAAAMLAPEFTPDLGTTTSGDIVIRLTLPAAEVNRLKLAASSNLVITTSLYPAVIGDIAAIMGRLIPEAQPLLSEGDAPLDVRLEPAKIISGDDVAPLTATSKH